MLRQHTFALFMGVLDSAPLPTTELTVMSNKIASICVETLYKLHATQALFLFSNSLGSKTLFEQNKQVLLLCM